MVRRWMGTSLGLVVALACAAVSGVPSAAATKPLGGWVVRVIDGDTITILTADRDQVRIRLADIDAPESHQPFGAKAKQGLSDLVYAEWVTVVVTGSDRYGRSIGQVWKGDVDVCSEMIRSGMAWAYRAHLTRAELLSVEREAREAHRGLWVQASPEPPWEFRADVRKPAPASEPSPSRPPVGASPGSTAPIVGNSRSQVYRRPDCPDYATVTGKHRVTFPSVAAAEAAGYRPARSCPAFVAPAPAPSAPALPPQRKSTQNDPRQ